jgi:hypothetical protein
MHDKTYANIIKNKLKKYYIDKTGEERMDSAKEDLVVILPSKDHDQNSDNSM